MNVLALVAHSDDEVIGCGGVLAKHAAIGDDVYLIVMADGVSSRENQNQDHRDQALLQSCDILGIKLLQQFDFKDNQLDRYPLLELVKSVEKCMGPIQFNTVYTHSKKDLNIDHRIVHDVALTLFRPLPEQTVKSIFAFETLSATHWYDPQNVFTPQRFVDIERYWPKKINAINAYDIEMREFPHARSRKTITVLAEFRGSIAGVNKAEAFEILRMVD